MVFTNSKRTLVKIIKMHEKMVNIKDKAMVLYPTVNIPIPEHEIKKEKMHYLLIVGRIDHEAFFQFIQNNERDRYTSYYCRFILSI